MLDVESYTTILASIPYSDGLDVLADYDYSDAPEWALPREWLIDGTYQLEYEPI